MTAQKPIFLFLIPVLMLMLAAQAGFAASVEGLYEAQVPMYGIGEADRKAAMGDALAQVLVKVSGTAAVLDSPAVQQTLDKAAAYAQTFRYLAYRPGQFYQLRERPRKVLSVSFDGNAVNNILHNAGQPLWGHSRPSVIVWLLVEDKGERRLVDARGRDQARSITEYAGTVRGLPVILPLMDLKDQGKVKPADIAGGFLDNLRTASTRYETEAILVGKVSSAGGKWNGRWTLIQDNRPVGWDGSAADLESAIIDGIGQATDRISASYAQVVDLSQSGTLLVRIDDVKSLRDYARAGRYLQSLAAVRNVSPVLMDKNHVMFEVEFQGSDEGLKKAIALGSVLVPAAISPALPPRRELPPGAATNQDPVGQDTRTAAVTELQPGVSYRLVP